MPAPRLVRPRTPYSICRRVNERRLLLRPDPERNQLFTWVLAVTAAQLEVDIHAATVMSTHFHPLPTRP